MELYVTSKNSGPSHSFDPTRVLYIGVSLEDARKAIEEGFQKYEVESDKFPTRFPHIWSAIPSGMRRDMIAFFDADGWWYSIVKIDV